MFFKQLGFPKPSFYLDINGLNDVMLAARTIDSLATLLDKTHLDIILAVGDTNTARRPPGCAQHNGA